MIVLERPQMQRIKGTLISYNIVDAELAQVEEYLHCDSWGRAALKSGAVIYIFEDSEDLGEDWYSTLSEWRLAMNKMSERLRGIGISPRHKLSYGREMICLYLNGNWDLWEVVDTIKDILGEYSWLRESP